MLRLLLWVWRYIVVGQPLQLFAKKCARQHGWFQHDEWAARYCANELCAEHCDKFCQCLQERVKLLKAAS